ncbi:hypothetical protein ACQ4PT_033023 [Festuca glaucescens]
MASKVELVVEVKSAADKLWTALRDSTELFPKIFPEQYKSIEDRRGRRQVRRHRPPPQVRRGWRLRDDEKKVVSYSVVDGELVSFYTNFRVTVQVTPTTKDGADAGAVVSWTMVFDKASEQVPEPDVIKETAAKTFHDLDDYLLKN